MLGIEDYGSDVDSGDESLNTTSTTPTTSSPSPLPKFPSPTSKPALVLPPPSLPSSSRSATTATSAMTSSKPKRTKKIAINLPSLPPPEDDEDDGPPAKKPRVAPSTGAGKSSLLSMLPAPKRPIPVIEKKEERVLGDGGGPGLAFRAPRTEAQRPVGGSPVGASDAGDAEAKEPTDGSGTSTSFLPPSLKKGRTNVSLEQAPTTRIPPSSTQPHAPTQAAPPLATDFFSLAGRATPPARSTPTLSASSVPSSSSFAVSSAPSITTFRPPSPTLDDPYPGYYQLPSGAYAPYDADYYASYARTWQSAYDQHIRALEKAQYEPEADGARDVDMVAEMAKARKEIKDREDRKALTVGKAGQGANGEPAMPRMNVKGAKLGAVARSRHQLTTLLTEAYLNREALEEKIAQGRRNRKEAGMKYGF